MISLDLRVRWAYFVRALLELFKGGFFDVVCMAFLTLFVLSRWAVTSRLCRAPLLLRCVVLQCVAVCCSVLQCVAVCCSVLQCVAVC